MLGIVPEEKPKELEDKETERAMGDVQRPEDIVTTYQFEEEDLVVKEPPKFKIPSSHFEQG
jgi:hypothetical protein